MKKGTCDAAIYPFMEQGLNRLLRPKRASQRP